MKETIALCILIPAMLILCLAIFNLTLLTLDYLRDRKERRVRDRLRAQQLRREILKLEGRDAEL